MRRSCSVARMRDVSPYYASLCATFERLEPRRLMSAYALLDLGTLGGAGSWAFDLNNAGQVVGYSLDATGQERGFVFTDANANGAADAGEMKPLGVLPGDAASYAYGINDAGAVVGTSRSTPLGTDGDERAVRFSAAGAATDLGLGRGSNAYGITPAAGAAPQIVGQAPSESPTVPMYLPFVRSAGGEVTTFSLPAPYHLDGQARAINDDGVIVGYSGSGGTYVGFIRLPDGSITPVGQNNPSFPFSYAWDVNDNLQVVGEGFTSTGEYHAFLWQDGAATDLGTLPGLGSSEAYGINASGTVVGRVEQPEGTPGPTHAFVYSNGSMRDLNALIPADSGWFVAEARAINDHGAIAAVAHAPGGAARAVLLVPTSPVAGVHVFYNNSAFDGRDPAANAADDDAIAPDKEPLAPGQAATFANVTSYSRGMNGVMIDLAATVAEVGAADFGFRVARGDAPGAWAPAPPPRSVTTRAGAGASGSDRITLTWDDYAIRDAWLEVTVFPTPATGLSAAQAYTFGNLVGETGDFNAASGSFAVRRQDLFATRARMPSRGVSITDPNDFNRDRTINSIDLALVRSNLDGVLTTASPTPAGLFDPMPATRTLPSRRSSLLELLA